MIDKDGNKVIRKSDLDSYVFYNEKGEIASEDVVMQIMENIEMDYGPRVRGAAYDPRRPVVFGNHGDNYRGELQLYYKAQEVRNKNEVVYLFNRDGFIAADKMNNVIGKLRTPGVAQRMQIAAERLMR
jgi:hypothetical protein